MIKTKEGKALIYVKDSVFFNPKMSDLRDISVAFIKALNLKSSKLLESTAATGVRGIRYRKEAGIKNIIFLDINKGAYLNTKANLKLNKMKFPVLNKSIQEFANTTSEKFDIIDIDPFGSPQPYIYDIMKISGDNTILMVTATDTAVLCGAHAQACYKIYNSKPLHNEVCKEVGSRILIDFISRTASPFNFGIEPLLTISSQHYIRVFIRLKHGFTYALSSIASSGFGSFCSKCHNFSFKQGLAPKLETKCSNCNSSSMESFGSLWLGNLYDKSIVRNIKSNGKSMGKGAQKIIETINNELDTPMFYSIPKITKSRHTGSVSHYKVIKTLKAMGFNATATQFDENGVKTDATVKNVIKAVSKEK